MVIAVNIKAMRYRVALASDIASEYADRAHLRGL